MPRRSERPDGAPGIFAVCGLGLGTGTGTGLGTRTGLGTGTGTGTGVAGRSAVSALPRSGWDLPAGGAWMTQEEAAAHLGIGRYHLNALTCVTHRVDMVRTTGGKELAVVRADVEAEKHWRATATVGQKVWRLLKDALTRL
ncbi:hypothetical protein [Kitasatospora sp. NPDC059599]|uniref:hypothetical protein n=1 Tax=Kitasatospora sp. NPDC059599 TaxID=3346880 RepID=UPI0036A6F4FB